MTTRTLVRTTRGLLCTAALLSTILYASGALAEGTVDLGVTQALRAGTILNVDILGTGERIAWTGFGSVDVYGPSGAHLGSLASGQNKAPSEGVGAYALRVNSTQQIGSTWDVSVTGRDGTSGRLWSKNWQFNAGSYAASAGTNASFYALVESGGSANRSVIELKLDGLAGYIYDVNANQTGVNGVNAGRSVPELGNSVTPMYPIYLRIPEVANFDEATPAVSALGYIGGVDEDVFGQPMTPCGQILPGDSRGYFSFDSATAGSYQLQCDLDHDGEFSIGGGTDLLLLGAAGAGTNVVSWNGIHNDVPVAAGVYECRVRVTVGEFHYVGRDIETSYSGLRIYRVLANGDREGLPMYWNDSLVQNRDARMPNNAYGLASSEGAIVPGAYSSPAVANTNARSWGNFTGAGKGNETYLDTFVWLDEAVSAPVSLIAADSTDGDGDGLTDYEESCLIGSSPGEADTDQDGTADGEQYAVPGASAFAGLESNGRMATGLAIRAIRETRMSLDRRSIGSLAQAISQERLSQYLPDQIEDGVKVADSPDDLLDMTNARSIVGVDYVTEDGERRGGALLVDTAGEFYEHHRGVCDRVRGGRLLDVRTTEFHGLDLLQSTVSSIHDGRLEQAASLYLAYDTQAEMFQAASFWVSDDAPPVEAEADALTLQVWGDTTEFVHALLEAVAENIDLDVGVAWPTPPTPIADEDVVDPTFTSPELVSSESSARRAPSVLIERGETLGGRVNLVVRRMEGSGAATVRVTKVDEASHEESSHVVELDVAARSQTLSLDEGMFVEATIDIIDRGQVVDRVWMSDGTWAPFNDELWGQNPTSHGFSNVDCTPRRLADELDGDADDTYDLSGAVRFSGCARAVRSEIAEFAGVARTFIRPLDTSRFGAFAYYVKSDAAYEVCLEGSAGRACVSMPASPSGKVQAIPLDAFRDAPAETSLVSFATEASSVDLELSALTLLESRHDTRPAPKRASDKPTCALAAPPGDPGSPASWFALVAFGFGVQRLRRRHRTSNKSRV